MSVPCQNTITEELLSDIVRHIVASGNPTSIVLFGSHARGMARPESDLDLLIIEESELPRYQRASKYRRALVGIYPSKDIVVWTPEEVYEWRSVPSAFITTALAEGRVLYERSSDSSTRLVLQS